MLIKKTKTYHRKKLSKINRFHINYTSNNNKKAF